MLNRFLLDEGGPASSLELDCLSLAVGSPTILDERPPHLGRDVGQFAICNIIAGPLESSFKGSSKWLVPEYPAVVQTFNAVWKLDRKNEYQHMTL